MARVHRSRGSVSRHRNGRQGGAWGGPKGGCAVTALALAAGAVAALSLGAHALISLVG